MTERTRRLLALSATTWHNWKINEHVKQLLIAYDHQPTLGIADLAQIVHGDLV